MDSTSSFEPLPAAEGGPSHTRRLGDTSRRAAGPWTPTIHALLRHLEKAGFTGSPRVLGDGFAEPDGAPAAGPGGAEEVLTWIEGDIVHPHAWPSEDAVHRVGRMLHDLHTAGSTFEPPPDAQWQPWWMHRSGPDSVIGHCDAGPWHVVARNGEPVAFIDWTLAGPVDRLDEVAATAWWHAQLHDDDVAARHALPDPDTRARQVRAFLDGYELPRNDRARLVTRMIEIAIRDCAAEAARAGITPESADPGPLWSLAWRARAADWMIRHRTLLEQAVTG
ncbi:aminoglycoside phosphotransferase family protein [Hamadaea sp. NPDC050747]|uniref:aminoglycoside phosphotransferase family protein n=1 Tax=Hamadaea sp. NPDC050747 TaxID=3155789 RepID=UPI0033BFFE96